MYFIISSILLADFKVPCSYMNSIGHHRQPSSPGPHGSWREGLRKWRKPIKVSSQIWGDYLILRLIQWFEQYQWTNRALKRKWNIYHSILAWLGLKVWSTDSLLMFWRVKILRNSGMLQVKITLLNGNPELLTLLHSSTVQDVRTKAQGAFGKKYLKLVNAKNCELVDPDKTLEEAEIEDGECLTALVLQPQLAATSRAFALWCHGDSAIVTWGSARYGGDSSAVRDHLRGVQHIQATHTVFAAIVEDGSVVTWGDAQDGGDSSAVRDQLKGV